MSSWGTPSRVSTAIYRERTASERPITLRRGRCACGKIVTAKQLVQYGACVTCVRAVAKQIQEAA